MLTMSSEPTKIVPCSTCGRSVCVSAGALYPLICESCVVEGVRGNRKRDPVKLSASDSQIEKIEKKLDNLEAERKDLFNKLDENGKSLKHWREKWEKAIMV